MAHDQGGEEHAPRSLLVSLAHEETYYSVFNEFIRCHPSVLEEDGFGFLKHCGNSRE